ncbi:hypothetical protein JAAARDRAFT_193982 [Jaapia argillacea MUCL 33604]|uniref:Uncharacterized protein n=1 Tax=Jaapia argillacea MUCL 33604 TaxID=933084 RepID=A0A067Q2H4_9AGAM|nr:hypothetical protein JAAARDRAFT_193982 [Jaapia argillacea MUCL 33604]
MGLTRTHSRTSSGSSSKLALNLQFTQKDPPQTKPADKPKKSGLHHEVQQRPVSQFPRISSKQRIRSREQLPQLVKHAPPPAPAHDNRLRGPKAKVGFTIASPSTDEDEDEWVSSESAGPSRQDSDNEEEEEEDDDEPQEVTTPVMAEPTQQLPTPPPVIPRDMIGAATPRGEPSLSRVPTVRPTAPELHEPAAPHRAPSAPPSHAEAPQLSQQRQQSSSRPETPTSPPRTVRQSSKRSDASRPPSMYSIASKGDPSLRPHPLIRGHSFGQGAPYPPKPAPLAPLTVTSDAAPAKLSSSASPPRITTGQVSTSPTSSKSSLSPLEPSNRRTSISSARSVATLPANGPQSQLGSRSGHDRTRTLSTMSTSSSSSMAALSSLAHLPGISRPPTPQLVTHFPPVPSNLESIHPLLPPPYLTTHLTVSRYRSPIRESFDRVIRAKQAR